jgi:hypothetical protein
MLRKINDRRLVTAIGLLSLYSIATTAYIATLSPQLIFLGGREQEATKRAITLEHKLRKLAGIEEPHALFGVSLHPNVENSDDIQVYVKRENSAYPFAVVQDVYMEHYHPAELQEGTLFILRRLHGDAGAFTDELWTYSITGKSQRLFAGRGIDFRASPSGVLVAIESNSSLIIERTDTAEMHTISIDELAGANAATLQALTDTNGEPPQISLEGWSGDSKEFWGSLGWVGIPSYFFRIDPITGAVESFNTSVLQNSGEYVLEPNTARIAYSSYPRMFDTDTEARFRVSKSPVELRVLHLLDGRSTPIGTSAARPFTPLWTGTSTLEFAHPKLPLFRTTVDID